MRRLIGSQRGMALREILMLGLFAAVFILGWKPIFGKFIARATEGTTKGNLADLRSKVNIFYAHERRYPGQLYTELAKGEYLEIRDDTPSLGKFVIPAHGDNPGHEGPLYRNAASEDAVTYRGQPPMPTDETPILYVHSGTVDGTEVYINCTHRKTNGLPWGPR